MRAALTDGLVLTRRNLTHVVRNPQLLIFSTIQPVMFVLLFRYVFGGAINVSGTDYVNFLMPGIFVQTTAFGATLTGIGLAEDMSKGIIDRFRSLPMARSAVLLGRTCSDAVRNVFIVALMTAVGVAVGLRFQAGAPAALGAVALVVAFGFAFSWISATIGLSVKDPEAAQAGGFIWVFPLTFASSAFVPVESMPGWLQPWARNQPLSRIVDAARALIVGGPTTSAVLWAAFWILLILLVFVPLAVARYRRVT